ncbi:hypothetical protein N7510_007408 [Penicillium lagena]|uniref:uncharacterized protein n=1 Tax=Penicillium lagena TaxID=94218 RepID=UPI002541D2FF|nr:uncharacterized protein N7510_007408 [Penicillium lagena]KAJ5610689.1 hypothetical protein N7510_007408 [Penicillium lagena]
MDDSRRSPSSIPRKRRRPALSCEQCRRRKVRCDREMPCGPCSKTHDASACSYVYEGKTALESRFKTSLSNENEPTSRLSSTLGASTSADTPLNESRMTQLERSIQLLQERVQGLENKTQGGNGSSRLFPADGGNDGAQDVTELHDRIARLERQLDNKTKTSETLIPSLTPYLKVCGDRSKRSKTFGTTHWAQAFQRLYQVRQAQLLSRGSESNPSGIGKGLKTLRSLRQTIKGWQAPRLQDPAPDLLRDLPAREICDQLVRHYMRTLELIYRVLHVPSFYQDYDSFWEQPHSASTAFLLKLLLILAIGSIFHCEAGPCNSLGLPIRRWIYAAHWWLTGPSEKDAANLEGLQVHCLLHLCRQTHAIDKESNWTSAGSLLRLAINQGLNRDPKHFPSLSVFDGEMRRRVWGTVLELNLQLSLDTAMPPLLTKDDFDTELPSNLDDQDFDKSTITLPATRPIDNYTHSSMQILLLRSFNTRLQIAKIINQCNIKQSYETSIALDTELNTSCKEMTVLFREYLAHTPKRRLGPTPFHHRLLDTLLRRFLLNLHRPFTVQALEDPRFYLSRKLSLESAMATASYTEFPDNPQNEWQQDFYRLSLSGAGLFKFHLSLDVIVVIGLEVTTQIADELSRKPAESAVLPPNAVDQMAQSARAPLIQALQLILEQLHQGIAAGIPSMKRYFLLVGILAQIHTMHGGEQAVQTKIKESFLENLEECRRLLQQYISDSSHPSPLDGNLQVMPQGVNVWTPESGMASNLGSEIMGPEPIFDALDFWDLPPFMDAEAFFPSELLENQDKGAGEWTSR